MPEQTLFACFLEPARAGMPSDPTPGEADAVARHAAYYETLRGAGTLLLAGRTLEPPFVGLMLFRADSPEQAQRIVDADPAVESGVMLARIQPYRIAMLGDLTEVMQD